MSFWNSRVVKARKPHTCIYCGKHIEVGECYSRESGMYEGEFQDYCLCNRCRFLLEVAPEEDGYLIYLYDKLSEQRIIKCPKCGSECVDDHPYAEDKQSCECECQDCGADFIMDLSLEALEKIFKERGLYHEV